MQIKEDVIYQQRLLSSSYHKTAKFSDCVTIH